MSEPILMRRLSVVPRWVIVPTIRNQNVAEHSFHVAWICKWLLGRIEGGFKPKELDVVWHALDHDRDEAITGDKPTPSKKGEPSQVTVDLKVHAFVKVADCMEALIFVWEEMSMGNKCLKTIEKDILERGTLWTNKCRSMGMQMLSFDELAKALFYEVNPRRHPAMEANNG